MTDGAPGAPTPRTTDLFVDAVEDGRARLILGEETFTVPAAVLPEGAREGSWIRLTAISIPAPIDPDVLRRRLGGDDPGGPIKL